MKYHERKVIKVAFLEKFDAAFGKNGNLISSL